MNIGAFLAFGLSSMYTMQSRNEEWKEKILQEWRESANYPRKKKKKVRKKLQIDWSIACFDPFQF